ncbi:MAG: DUF2807 domain-containing protein [Salinivirgaceae bacterium]|nr:DUF2807 domain-containing protein [Salinivirgaceae bacterium]MDD4747204.1 DUF2807 domain-containing protein [Salinivirgaceae bacterium]MDY0279432.1 DUF2807 domain-containing protein [Salinivirgaceae bacterium]
MNSKMKYAFLSNLLIGFIFGFTFVANSQSVDLNEFNELFIRGKVKVNYIYSENSYLEIETKEHADFATFKVENRVLKIKHSNFKPDRNKSVTINVYGGQLKTLKLKQGAILTMDSTGFSDSVYVHLASGSEMKAMCNLKQIKIIANRGSFAFLEGSLNSMNATVRSGAKIRCNISKISKADVKISTGGFLAMESSAVVTGKVSTGGELKFYGTSNKHRVKQLLKGKVISVENEQK